MVIHNQIPLDRMMTTVMLVQKDALQEALKKPGSIDKVEETLKIAADRDTIIDVVA